MLQVSVNHWGLGTRNGERQARLNGMNLFPMHSCMRRKMIEFAFFSLLYTHIAPYLQQR